MDAGKAKKKRSELELLLGNSDAGGLGAFSPRLPALSICSPSLSEAAVETDEQLARRLHEELNGTSRMRRGSKAVIEDQTHVSPTAKGVGSPHARIKADMQGPGGKAGGRAGSVAPSSAPQTTATVAADAGASVGGEPASGAGSGGAGGEVGGEAIKRKRNSVPARELHLLLQQASSTTARGEAGLSPSRSARGSVVGPRGNPPSSHQPATASASGGVRDAPLPLASAARRDTDPDQQRAQGSGQGGVKTASGAAGEGNNPAAAAPGTGVLPAANSGSAPLPPSPTSQLPPKLKQRYLAGLNSFPPPPDTAAASGRSGSGALAAGSAVTPSGMLAAGGAGCSLLSGGGTGLSLEGGSRQSKTQSQCQSHSLAGAKVADAGPSGADAASHAAGGSSRASSAAAGVLASVGVCSSTDETENDADHASCGAAVVGTGAAGPSTTSPKALPPPPALPPLPSASSLQQPQQHSDAARRGSSGGGGASRTNSGGASGPLKVPKLPMIRAGRGWYRGRLLKESPDGLRVLVEVPGAPNPASGSGGSSQHQQPFWLPAASDRIWRGSYKGKDWKYLGDGAWDPKPGAFKRGKQGSSSNGLPLPLPPWAAAGGSDAAFASGSGGSKSGPPVLAAAGGSSGAEEQPEEAPATRQKREREWAEPDEEEDEEEEEEQPEQQGEPQLCVAAAAEGASARPQRAQRRGSPPGPESAAPSDTDPARASGGGAAPVAVALPEAAVAVMTVDAATTVPLTADTTAVKAYAGEGESAGSAGGVGTEPTAGVDGSTVVGTAAVPSVCVADVAPTDSSRGGSEGGGAASAAVDERASAGGEEAVAAGAHGTDAAGAEVHVGNADTGSADRADDGCGWLPGVAFPRTRTCRRAKRRTQPLRTPLDGPQLEQLHAPHQQHPHHRAHHHAAAMTSGDDSGGDGDGAAASDAEHGGGGRRGSGDGSGHGRRRAAARAAAVAAAAARAEAEAEEDELEEILMGRRPPRRDRFNPNGHPNSSSGGAAKHPRHNGQQRSRGGAKADYYLYGDSSGALEDALNGDTAAGYGNGPHRGGGSRAHSQQPPAHFGTAGGGSASGSAGWEAGQWQQEGAQGANGAAGVGGQQPQRNRRKGKPSRSRMDGEGDAWCCGDNDWELDAAWARMPQALRQLYYAPATADNSNGGSATQQQQQRGPAGAGKAGGSQHARDGCSNYHNRLSAGGAYRGAQAAPHKRRKVYEDDPSISPDDGFEADDHGHDADYMPPLGGSGAGRRYGSQMGAGGRRCSGSGGGGGNGTAGAAPKRPRDGEQLAWAQGAADSSYGGGGGCMVTAGAPSRRRILVTGGGWLTSGSADANHYAGAGGWVESAAPPVPGPGPGRSGGGGFPAGLAGLLEAALGNDGAPAAVDLEGGNGSDGLAAQQQQQDLQQGGVKMELEPGVCPNQQQQQEGDADGGRPVEAAAQQPLLACSLPGQAAHVALSDSSANHSVGEEVKAQAPNGSGSMAAAAAALAWPLPGGAGVDGGGSPLPQPCGGSPTPSALHLRPATPSRARRTGRPPVVALAPGAPLPKLPALSSSASLKLQLAATADGGVSCGAATAADAAAAAPNSAGGMEAVPPPHRRVSASGGWVDQVGSSGVASQQCEPHLYQQQPMRTTPILSAFMAACGRRASSGGSGEEGFNNAAATAGAAVPLPGGCDNFNLWQAAGNQATINAAATAAPHADVSGAGGGGDALADALIGLTPTACTMASAAAGSGGDAVVNGGCSVMDAIGSLLYDNQPVMQQLVLRAQSELDSLGFAPHPHPQPPHPHLTHSPPQCQPRPPSHYTHQNHNHQLLALRDEQHRALGLLQSEPSGGRRGKSGALSAPAWYGSVGGGVDGMLCVPGELPPVPDHVLAALPSVEVVVNLFGARTPYGGAQQALADLVGAATALPLFR